MNPEDPAGGRRSWYVTDTIGGPGATTNAEEIRSYGTNVTR